MASVLKRIGHCFSANVLSARCTALPPVFRYDILQCVIMSAMASQITSLANVYSTVHSGTDQRKHQSSASLDFVREFTVHWLVISSIHYKLWDKITYPFPNFNGYTVEVWGWISNFIPHLTGCLIIYPCRWRRRCFETQSRSLWRHCNENNL